MKGYKQMDNHTQECPDFREEELEKFHFPPCTVPPYAKISYENFLNWCMERQIKEVGHMIAPLVSSKLRAKNISLEEFSAALFREGSELDGSSFATGGGRVVHKSKVTACPDTEGLWFMFPDPVRDKILYIMSDMVTPEGSVTCARRPLSLALKLLENRINFLMELAGKEKPSKFEKYTLTAGYEKEFFIMPKETASKRPDLKYLGQSVVGGPGPINQNLQGVYMTIPKRNEEALLADMVKDLAKVGIVAYQKHMEVGQTGNELNGRQCEVVIKYSHALEACDADLIARQIIEDVCDRHGFRALIGSKSFTENSRGDGINGSGKHTNISLGKYHIFKKEVSENLLSDPLFYPSQSQEQVNLLGLAIIAAMGRRWQVLDASIASRGNDLRRRPGFEAPVYLSAFIGNTSEFRDSLDQDRNRSVSIGLSGSKVEWRAPGANTPMHYPLSFLTMAIIEVLDEIIAAVKKYAIAGKSLQEAIDGEYARLRREVDYFIVDEDVYELTTEEAEKRFGYKAPENTPQALEILDQPQQISFLMKEGVFTEEMLHAFKMVQLETYSERVKAEAIVMSQMAKVISNKVFRSPLMNISSRELFDIDPRLKQRKNYLGQLNAELLALVDSSYVDENYLSAGKDLTTLLDEIKEEGDAEKTAACLVKKLLPLLGKIRSLYEKMEDIMGGGEEVAKL